MTKFTLFLKRLNNPKIKLIGDFIEKHLVRLIFLLLFVAPLFWFKYPKIDLGGDSGRIYLFDPKTYFVNTTLFPINLLGGLNSYHSRYVAIPMLMLFITLKLVMFNSSFLLNVVIYSLTLSLGFYFMYRFLNELNVIKKDGLRREFAVFASLFYSLSPLMIYDYQRANFHVYGYSMFPLVVFLIMRYLNYHKIRDLLLAVIVMFVFAFIFSTFNIPWLAAFFIPSGIFLFGYCLIFKKLRLLLIAAFILIFLYFVTHAFYILLILADLFDKSSDFNQAVFNPETFDTGLGYFQSIQPFVNLIYTFYNQPPFEIMRRFGNTAKEFMRSYGLYVLPVYSSYPLTMLSGLLSIRTVKENRFKLLFYFSILILLFMTFFTVANLGTLPLKIYEKLFIFFPPFRMFRHFYGKFAQPFTFFYAIVLYLALLSIENHLRSIGKAAFLKIFSYFLILLTLFNGIPLLTGKITNSNVPGSSTEYGNVSIPMKVPEDYLKSIRALSEIEKDAKIISFPFTMESYQVIAGENGGAYFGPSSIAMLSGKSDFNGFASFYNIKLPKTFYTLFLEESLEKMQRFMGMLNVGYIFHNSDDFLYTRFPSSPWGDFKKLFPTQATITDTILKMEGKKVYDFGNYDIYSMDRYYLPHIYTPEKIIVSNQDLFDFYKGHNFSQDPVRLGLFLKEPYPRELGENTKGEIAVTIKDMPAITFRKVNTTKYIVTVRNATQPYILSLSDQYNKDWLVYLNRPVDQIKEDHIQSRSHRLVGQYFNKIVGRFLPNNRNPEIIASYFDGQVSENIHANIFLEPDTFQTWGLKPLLTREDHFQINGYANSWYITPSDVDNQRNYELVIEFEGHRLFYIAAFVSFGTVLILCIFIVFSYVREYRR